MRQGSVIRERSEETWRRKRRGENYVRRKERLGKEDEFAGRGKIVGKWNKREEERREKKQKKGPDGLVLYERERERERERENMLNLKGGKGKGGTH